MLGGAVGAVAVWRWRRKPTRAAVADPDPAEELRVRLDESRSLTAEPVSPADPSQPLTDDGDPAARRQSVHEQARARIDELTTVKKEEPEP